MKIGQKAQADEFAYDTWYHGEGTIDAIQDGRVKISGQWFKSESVYFVDDSIGGSGQRWEPCPACGAEPVCNGCGYCEQHCSCQRDRDARQEAHDLFLRGFDWNKYIRHLEDGANEH